MLFDKGVTNLINFVNNMNDSDKKKLKDMLEKINKLDDKYKIKVFKMIDSNVNKVIKQMEQENNKNICMKEGHNFSEWNYYTCKQTVIGGDLGEFQEFEIEKKHWERTCFRCGFKENVEKEPKSVTKARLEQEKNEKIKQLKKEIKLLEKK